MNNNHIRIRRLTGFMLAVIMLLQVFTLSGIALADAVFAFESREYSVNVGKSIELKPILQGAKLTAKAKYAWSGENDAVAKVSSAGKVTGVAPGETRITVTVTDENDVSFTASCLVKVIQPVSKIKFEKETIKVAVGVKKSIAPVVSPADATNTALRYTSSDPAVCRVDDKGNITGLLANKSCTITAEATDGSGVKAKVKVEVKTFILEEKELVMTERKTYEVEINSNGNVAISLKYKRDGIFRLGKLLEGINNWFEVRRTEYVDEKTGKKVYKHVLVIEPAKAGTQTLTLYDTSATWGQAGATKENLKITVKPSAVYDATSFPALQYAQVIKDPAGAVGKTVSLQGVIMDVDSGKGEKKTALETLIDKGVLKGSSRSGVGMLKYTVATRGNTENTVVILVPEAFRKLANFRVGEKVKVFGVWTTPETRQTETGLQVVYPTVMIEKINDMIFNEAMTIQRAK